MSPIRYWRKADPFGKYERREAKAFIAETTGIKSKNSGSRVEKAYRSDRSAYCC
jgi:hypothetical protein